MTLKWIVIFSLLLLAIVTVLVATQTGNFLTTRTFTTQTVRDTESEPISGAQVDLSKYDIDDFTKIETFCLERKSGCEVQETGGKPPNSLRPSLHDHAKCEDVYINCMESTTVELATDAEHQLVVDAAEEELFRQSTGQ